MTKKKMPLLIVMLVFLLSASSYSCKNTQKSYVTTKSTISQSGGLATAHPLATEVGIQILKDGGNAVDAAIAVHFALAVVYPSAGNIGGGGFMMYRDKEGGMYALDFREKAPKLATQDMYLDDNQNVIPGLSTKGSLAVGVPGAVAGMEAAYERFSQLKDWNKLLEPAITLARNGFYLTALQAEKLNKKKSTFVEINPAIESPFTNSKSYVEGDLFVQKDLAKTLTAIQNSMSEGFYQGEVADKLVAQMKERGGLITHDDLQAYEAIWRDPITFMYKEYTVHSMPPPSSGGILLAQLFNGVEAHDFKGFHSTEDMHRIIEVESRSYADRAHFIGDQDFYSIPVRELTSKSYMAERMSDYDENNATLPDSISHGNIESEETTHFSIVDQAGGAVALTTTLNGSYGSSLIANGGYLLNNEMDDFSSKVGHPNLYGLVGAEANKIEPEKRMLSSMTPTIVEKDGQLYMVLGTPGGSTIITSVFQACINVMEYGMSMNDAIQSCRFHHQWKPSEVFYEEDCLNPSIIKNLQSMGHTMKSRSPIGRMEGILVTKDGYEIAADKRGDNHAMGY